MKLAVVDSNVIFSGLRSSRGYSFDVIQALRQGRFTSVLTAPLIFEYEDVLCRGGIAHLDDRDINEFLDWFASVSSLHEVFFAGSGRRSRAGGCRGCWCRMNCDVQCKRLRSRGRLRG